MHKRPNAHLQYLMALFALSLASSAWSQETKPASEAAPASAPTAQPEPSPRQAPPMLTPAEVEEQRRLAAESYEAGEYLKYVQSIMRLRNARPYEPEYMEGMVIGGALLNRPKTAYSYMHKMQQQGLTYDFNQTDDTESIRSTEVYTYINSLLVKAAEPFGESKVAFDLPEDSTWPEAMAWDEGSERLLVGTQEGGKIIALTLDGKVSELLSADKKNGMNAIYGLAVDAERNRLWVSSAATPAFGKLADGELGRTALLEFDLESLELLNRFEPTSDQGPHLLGALVLSPAGDVYVLDRAHTMLLVKPAAGKLLSPFMANKQLTRFRDLAISDNGEKLYVADANMGILVVDLEKQVAGMLAGPESLNLGAISGLDYSNGRLYVLQDGIAPQRLQRIDLDPSGTSAANIILLASGLEQYQGPSFGRVHGEDIYYFAGGNLDAESGGDFKPVILSTPVEPMEGAMTVEERFINEQMQGGKRQ
jgi:hypothetical protein